MGEAGFEPARTHKASADLQSAAVDRLATLPDLPVVGKTVGCCKYWT